jgi:hypothetical protein
MALPQCPSRLPDTERERRLVERGGPAAGANTTGLRCLIIVAREATDLWLYLTRTYGQIKGFQVLVDRRERERRQQVEPYAPERRHRDRRSPPTIENTLRRQPFLFIPQ